MSLTVAGAVLPQQPHDQVLRVGEPELVEQPLGRAPVTAREAVYNARQRYSSIYR
jgi:hypothetical protein